jgi:hypothetical protein
LRPLVRRNFTCAHELGHHAFGHGFTVDELVEGWQERKPPRREEFLAQTFAGFLLLPALGVRRAFTTRGWSGTSATPVQFFTVACSFGVGYTSLVYHLAYSLHLLPESRAEGLLRVALRQVRRELLGSSSAQPLIVVDEQWQLPTVDAQVGMQLLFPADTEAIGDELVWQADLPVGRLFQATRSGIAQVAWRGGERAVFARVAKTQYTGLAKFRHLEDDDDDYDEPIIHA